jgi:hypothetical protein
LKLLEAVARSREKGVTQIDLKDTFNVDAKSIFYYVKNLIIRGYLYVRRIAAVGDKRITDIIFY